MSVNFIFPESSIFNNHPFKTQIIQALAKALETVAGDKVVETSLKIGENNLMVQNDIFPLDPKGKLVIAAFGKAAVAMLKGAQNTLDQRIDRSLVVTKKKTECLLPNTKIVYGDHPVPGQNSLFASRQLETFIRSLSPADTLVCLISGGTSSLLSYPRPPITLNHLQRTTRLLLQCGASIQEINCIRKHLERFKGGGLVSYAHTARVISLILSDVIGDDPATIASGMTSPDPTTFAEAIQIIQHYHIEKKIPPRVLQYLQDGNAGKVPETPKPEDPQFMNVKNYLIGTNSQACQAASNTLQQMGISTLHLTSYLQGEACQVGKVFAALTRQLSKASPFTKPICWIAGGETTVTVHGTGIGGRNLELALGAVKDLAGIPNSLLITLASDGEDGLSPAAGALVDGTTWQRALELGLNPDSFLANNDSYNFFHTLGDVFYTSPTETNVNDLVFLFVY